MTVNANRVTLRDVTDADLPEGTFTSGDGEELEEFVLALAV
jgi:hypothetical protein